MIWVAALNPTGREQISFPAEVFAGTVVGIFISKIDHFIGVRFISTRSKKV